MENNSFKISAEILQKNAMKASIRDLNAEFQMKGGRVTPSKKGDTYQLFHPDEAYLEEFRIRLFRELGLIEEKDVPKELQGPKAPPPRYGDKHQLRRGWNVRSEREIKQGIYNKDDIKPVEREPQREKGHFRDDRRPRPYDQDRSRPYQRDDRRSGPHDRRGHGERPSSGGRPVYQERPPAGEDEDDGIRSFEERWGNIDVFMELIEEALKDGSVDDGQIIKFAYSKELPEEEIKKLKKLLWDNRCRGPREKCPHGKKKLRFEDMMKVCSGKVEGWESIDSPFTKFLDIWTDNMEKMYSKFRERQVEVEGKISSFKSVHRKGHEHLKILIYDTSVKLADTDEDPTETRKFWIKITSKEFSDLLGETKIHIDDIVKFHGKCVYDKYFFDYWVVDLKSLEVIKENGGEVLSAPSP